MNHPILLKLHDAVRNDVLKTRELGYKYESSQFSNIRSGFRPYMLFLPGLNEHFDNYLKATTRIILYDGGLGMGNYIRMYFDSETETYILGAFGGDGDNRVSTLFETKNWDEMFEYTQQWFIDLAN